MNPAYANCPLETPTPNGNQIPASFLPPVTNTPIVTDAIATVATIPVATTRLAEFLPVRTPGQMRHSPQRHLTLSLTTRVLPRSTKFSSRHSVILPM
jgi:hypothetical protein